MEAIAPTLSAEKNEGLAATAQHGQRRPSGEIREPTQDAGPLQGECHRVVEAYRADLETGRLPYTQDDLRNELCGVNVACYCSEDEDCHGDVVLEAANR